MSLKRTSLKQRSKPTNKSDVTSSNNSKKKVRFCDDANTSIPPAELLQAEVPLWYTPQELTAQLEKSKSLLASHNGYAYAFLLSNTYTYPHVSVQENLNAFCACESLPLRGLENHLQIALRKDRAHTRKHHVQAVLSVQRDTEGEWEQLCQASRQSSAPSKFFAMRLGRADARFEENVGAADELVQEKEQRRSRTKSFVSRDSNSRSSFICVQPKLQAQSVIIVMPDNVIGKFPRLSLRAA